MVAELTAAASGAVGLDHAIADLGARLRGELIRPADAAYDAARRVYMGNIDRFPALVVRARAVIAVGNFAREQALSSPSAAAATVSPATVRPLARSYSTSPPCAPSRSPRSAAAPGCGQG